MIHNDLKVIVERIIRWMKKFFRVIFHLHTSIPQLQIDMLFCLECKLCHFFKKRSNDLAVLAVLYDCSSRHMFAALTVMTRLRAYSGQVVFTLIDLAPGPLRALLCPAIHQHSYTSSNAIKTSFAFGKNMIVLIYPIFFFQQRIKQHQDCDEDLQELPWQNCSYFFLKCWMLIPRVLSAPQYFLQMWLVIQWYRGFLD